MALTIFLFEPAGIEVIESELGLSDIAPWLPHDQAYERLFLEQHSPFGIRLLQFSCFFRREIRPQWSRNWIRPICWQGSPD